MHCSVTYDARRWEGVRAVLCIEDRGKRLELTADHLVLTAGRSPNTEGLGLSELGIETHRRGAIVVGDDMQTTRPGVYAAGDVTDPQVAGVGLTEAEAIAAGHDVKISVLSLANVPRALAVRDTRGLVKLVADARTDRLLGGVIAAPEGFDSIQTLALALKFGMTTKALGETIFPYLTTVEGLKLAAQTFDMDVAKLSCCAG